MIEIYLLMIPPQAPSVVQLMLYVLPDLFMQFFMKTNSYI